MRAHAKITKPHMATFCTVRASNLATVANKPLTYALTADVISASFSGGILFLTVADFPAMPHVELHFTLPVHTSF